MSKNVYSILICFILLFVFPTFAQAYTFTRTLTLGSEGQDVYELQRFLNTNSATQVSPSGVGSPGNETNYFGIKTKEALARFQTINASVILAPLGLSVGTGYFGQSTITFINSSQLQSNSQNPSTSNQSTVTLSVPTFVISNTVVVPDEIVYVGSESILTDITFTIGGQKLSQKCQTQYTCALTIPSKINPGTYAVSSSDQSLGTYEVTVLDKETKKPVILTEKINLNTDTVIKGENFDEQMTVYTPFQTFTTFTRNNSFILGFDKSFDTSTPGFIVVENKNGVKSDTLFVQYEI